MAHEKLQGQESMPLERRLEEATSRMHTIWCVKREIGT